MSNDQSAMAKRMINASICAYQIHPKGWKPDGLTPLQTRTIQGPGDAYFYNVVPLYQDVAAAHSAVTSYLPCFQ